MINDGNEVRVTSNPIYRYIVDSQIIDGIFIHTTSLADEGLESQKDKLRLIYHRIKANCPDLPLDLKATPEENLVFQFQALSSQQLIHYAAEIFKDISEFASCVHKIYGTVKTGRELTEEEKALGNRLVTMLTSLKKLLPGDV